mmetsp:Transcript_28070/g.66506  ORF Transcript_28070/g.66506 Transcript_28070/m.66506 type:complete len:227 (+) Transcript_28070:259-939(+)
MTQQSHDVPYGDCFLIVIQLVARETPVGVTMEMRALVNFVQSTFWARKIESEAIKANKEMTKAMVEYMQQRLKGSAEKPPRPPTTAKTSEPAGQQTQPPPQAAAPPVTTSPSPLPPMIPRSGWNWKPYLPMATCVLLFLVVLLLLQTTWTTQAALARVEASNLELKTALGRIASALDKDGELFKGGLFSRECSGQSCDARGMLEIRCVGGQLCDTILSGGNSHGAQ